MKPNTEQLNFNLPGNTNTKNSSKNALIDALWSDSKKTIEEKVRTSDGRWIWGRFADTKDRLLNVFNTKEKIEFSKEGSFLWANNLFDFITEADSERQRLLWLIKENVKIKNRSKDILESGFDNFDYDRILEAKSKEDIHTYISELVWKIQNKKELKKFLNWLYKERKRNIAISTDKKLVWNYMYWELIDIAWGLVKERLLNFEKTPNTKIEEINSDLNIAA